MKTSFLLFAGIVMAMSVFPISADGSPIEVQMFDHKSSSGRIELRLDGKPVHTFLLSGLDTYSNSPVLNWPAETSIAGSGEYSKKRSWFSRPERGEQKWTVLDVAPLVIPLRDTQRSMPDRVSTFLQAKNDFEKTHSEIFDSPVSIEFDEKQSAESIRDAEKRLGFSLPPEHRDLLQKLGVVIIADSHFMKAESLFNSFDQMVQVWETPTERLLELSKDTQELLRKSVILYTEVGDGFGALLYKPAVSAGGPPEFYWIHQDSISSPKLLRNNNGELKSYSDAVRFLFIHQLFPLFDAGPGYVFRDSSATNASKYFLSPDAYADDFSLRLDINWESLE